MTDTELETMLRDALTRAFPAGTAAPAQRRATAPRRTLLVAAVVLLCLGIVAGAVAISRRGHSGTTPPGRSVPVTTPAPHTSPAGPVTVAPGAGPALGDIVGRFWVFDHLDGRHGTLRASQHPSLASKGTEGAWVQFSRNGTALIEDTVNVWNDQFTLTPDGMYLEAGAVSAAGAAGAPGWLTLARAAMASVTDHQSLTLRLTAGQLVIETPDGYRLWFRAAGTAPESVLLGTNDDYTGRAVQPSPLDAVRGHCNPGQVLGVDGLVEIPPVRPESVQVRWTSDRAGTGTVHTAVVMSQGTGFVTTTCG